jgi:hypothetical protein
MPTDVDMFDFERDFLSDVLRMLGERLSKLHSHVDWEHPEESYLFDPMEHLAGVGVVAAQRYIASICNWLSVDKGEALKEGPKKKGVPVAAVINAAANYWKHIEDGEAAVWPKTRHILEQIGVKLDSSYCVSNALYECGYRHFAGLMEDLIAWRNALFEMRAKKTT